MSTGWIQLDKGFLSDLQWVSEPCQSQVRGAARGHGACGQSHHSQVHNGAGTAWKLHSASQEWQFLPATAATGPTAWAPSPSTPHPLLGAPDRTDGQGLHRDQPRTLKVGRTQLGRWGCRQARSSTWEWDRRGKGRTVGR